MLWAPALLRRCSLRRLRLELHAMHLDGDESGIGQLKELVKENKEYLKFLVNEARSNADHTTTFRGKNGVKYRLKLELASGNLHVEPAADA